MTMATAGAAAWSALDKLRDAAPLVQCITNFVSMDLVANALLAAGASPAMVHAQEETYEFTAIADALCINVGTLTPAWLSSMKAAASRALESGKPWLLDPAGAGSSSFRTNACFNLLRQNPSVVRGNATEILALAGAAKSPTKGVDSSHSPGDALAAAKQVAKDYGCVVAVTGPVDLVTDGNRVLRVNNGVPLMQKITASGCAVSALVAAFVSVNPAESRLETTAFALAIYGLAGELGMAKSSGPATLRLNLIDALHCLDEATVTAGVKISQLE